ncbi:uncharacterized protein [Heterodontus francisci]|uniref:uncharacterized protein n=1 Tax=Heterodontus francisci TaxID=7792 RepID=UPI00355C2A5D
MKQRESPNLADSDCFDWKRFLQKYVIAKWPQYGEYAGHTSNKGKPVGEALWKIAQAKMSARKFKKIQKSVAIGCLLEEWIECQQQAKNKQERLEEENKKLREETARLSEKETDLQGQRSEDLMHMNQYQLQCEKLVKEKSRREGEAQAAKAEVEGWKQQCSDLKTAMNVIQRAAQEKRSNSGDHTKCQKYIVRLQEQLAMQRGIICAVVPEGSEENGEGGIDWNELADEAARYGHDDGDPLPEDPPPAYEPEPKEPSAPMAPLVTTRAAKGADGQVAAGPRMTYSTPMGVQQLRDIAKDIGTCAPGDDPRELFQAVSQQRGIHSLDDAEERKLIIMCLHPHIHSALPEEQKPGRGTNEDLKEQVLNVMGANRGDPVEALTKCYQRKGEHPVAFVARIWRCFKGYMARTR